ncbi:MAG: DsbC family protein [Tibeticola sp.]
MSFLPTSAFHGAWVAAALLIGSWAYGGEPEIREALKPSLPPDAKIEEIRPSPVPGIFEVRINADEIYYVDGTGRYLFQGSLLDTKARANLTRERVESLHPLTFEKAPLQDAIAIKHGAGSRKLVLFADPNCSYCRKLEAELEAVDDVTVYAFMIPILGPDSNAKARNIWCNADRAQTWSNWMLKSTEPPKIECPDTSALTRNVNLATRHKVSGTPTLFFEDGSRIVGPVSAAAVEARLKSSAKK